MDADNKDELTRAFICISFPDEAVKEVARLQEMLGNRIFTGKMTELENLHLTLKFLGEIDDETLGKVKQRLSKIKFSEFEAKLGELGTFSTRGNPRLVWIKLNGEGIWGLQRKIDETLNEIFKPEERFMSHTTIARVKYVKDKKEFVNYVKNIGSKEIKFKVGGFKLAKSELQPSGPTYTLISEFKAN